MSLEDADKIHVKAQMNQAAAAEHESPAAQKLYSLNVKNTLEDEKRRLSSSIIESTSKIESAQAKVSENRNAMFQTFTNAFVKGKADTGFLFQLMMQSYQFLRIQETNLKVYLSETPKIEKAQDELLHLSQPQRPAPQPAI